MAFDFVENTTITLPDIGSTLFEYSESHSPDANKLIMEYAAIHEGLTANYNFYSAGELEASLSTWVQPFPRPLLINHDVLVNPLGRVMAARMDKEADGTPFVRLQVGISDDDAVKRVVSKRYMTGSVGGKAKSAKCSICDIDWAEGDGLRAPCTHKRGKVYNGKLAYFKLGGLQWKEYSFVNVPADERSMELPSSTSAEEEGWTRAAKVFSIDMNNESIVEFSESAQPINILDNMKKKDARYTYTNLKGTWLAVSAYNDLEDDKINENVTNHIDVTTIPNEALSTDTAEEHIMSEEATNEVEEQDITAVLTQLSDDLAATSEKVEEETSESTETDSAEESSAEEGNAEETTEEPTTEGDQPEAVEAPDDEGEPEGDEEESGKEEEKVGEESTEEQLADQEVNIPEESAPAEESDERDALIERLTDENKQLKAMLHRTLAERVVDKKIDLGLVESTDRSEELAAHITRSASSLADSLKDLHKLNPKVTVLSTESVADIEQSIVLPHATGTEPIESFTESPEKKVSPEEKYVDLMFDVLTGKRSL